ncbi:unnamed protein product [Nippostrongylus brasiliensis]|uniref:Ground-like domain-containing protein n=1 Tax=Nippostrongylus brasiliensis TaxID=27835 RepID=A0A0N4Y3E6_NIPBR|nr:unnamed protein product [Nippostrongylus brasiliensis]
MKWSLLLIWVTAVDMQRRTQYVRLPNGGLTLADRLSPHLRDAYNIKDGGSPGLSSDASGGLVAPPRAEPAGSENSPPNSYPENAPVPSKGLSYAEFKQLMQMKITEKLKQTPMTPTFVEPQPIEPYLTASPPAPPLVESGPTSPQPGDVAPSAVEPVTAVPANEVSTIKNDQEISTSYRELFQKNGFSPLQFLLNHGGVGTDSQFFVPVPIVVPPPPPPPPGPKCYTNPSGFLCCNVSLERTMEMAYVAAKSEGISSCNVQRMASAVQAASEEKFKTTFETVAAHRDFVAKVNFAGDLNCKIEVDGKFILAYATPKAEKEVR